jgi:hypothetical protein
MLEVMRSGQSTHLPDICLGPLLGHPSCSWFSTTGSVATAAVGGALQDCPAWPLSTLPALVCSAGICTSSKIYHSTWTAIAKFYTLGSFNSRHLFPQSSGGWKFKIMCPANSILVRAACLACRWLPLHCVLT